MEQRRQLQQQNLQLDADGYYITNDYVKTLGETINVRVAASTDADIYKLLPGGEILNRVGYNEEWTKVMVDGSTFYVYSEYVIQTEPPAGTMTDTTDGYGNKKRCREGKEDRYA